MMPKLPRAPLQEAIFEIRWELDPDSISGQMIDPGFQLAQGKLQEISKDEFPVFNRKLPHGFPEQLLSYQIINQYWSGRELWPVIQLGPGIFTVNITETSYDWPITYFPLIKKSLTWLVKVYDNKIRINFASLRYIDSVKLKDYNFDGQWQNFIIQHFNFSFVNSFNTRGNIKGLQFNQFFDLSDGSELHIMFNSGKDRKTDDDALIWQTSVAKQTKFNDSLLVDWLEYAHTTTSTLFKEMTKPEFYDSFR